MYILLKMRKTKEKSRISATCRTMAHIVLWHGICCKPCPLAGSLPQNQTDLPAMMNGIRLRRSGAPRTWPQICVVRPIL